MSEPIEPDDWVAELWHKMKPAARGQVRIIATALQSARTGELTADDRKGAWWEAHRLAGSLGSYGFDDGAAAAAGLSEMLEGDGEIPLPDAVRLIVRLNAVVSD